MTATRSGLLAFHTNRELSLARETLGDFIVDQAAKSVADLGFDWVLAADAPRTYLDLRHAFELSELDGRPLPVSAENSESVIYADPVVNFALRYWHDVSHVQRSLTFDLVDELELSLWHLSVLEGEGFPPETIVWQLLHADLIGAVYTMALARRFPLQQLRFAEGCVSAGFDAGLLPELRHES